jgi:hypothetical protein
MQTIQTFDERTTLDRLNRLSLYYLLKICGFDVQDTMPKEKMLKLADAHSERVDFKKVQTYNDGFGGIRVIRPDRFKEEDAAAADAFEKEKKTYDGKSKKELMTIGLELNLKFDYKMKSEEMVSAIMAATKSLAKE